ncbi:hypothetical protein N8H69_05395 [Achromobacter spanius]|uniref:hypothetical protein n=1 Tax=Achromobacter spanius TaxID=217203 RepID=UPI002225BE07|nr:hypothetical protein [Achromobacter spanius]MCW3151960.1 hypothetical protein [Achromobacter spanius]
MQELDAGGDVVLRLDSIDSAVDLIKRLNEGETVPFPDRFEFTGELAALHIVVSGANYHCSVPGAFARGIWGFQEEIYRAVAYALYDVADLRKLSKADHERFNLVFAVSEGSSGLDAPTSGFLSELAKGLSNMSEAKKLAAIIAVAIVLASAYAVSNIGGSYYKAQTSATASQAEVEKERERTKQIEALVGVSPLVKRFEEATAVGGKQIIKSVPDATNARIGNTHFDRSDIVDINARAAKESPDSISLRQDFKVIAYKRAEGSDFARFVLISPSGEIPAILDMSDGGPFTALQLQRFWGAVQAQSPILLGVEVKTAGGAVKQAWISEIPESSKSTVTALP